MARRKKEQFKPGSLVRPVQAFSIVHDGVGYTFTMRADPVSADHVIVREYPQYFRALDPAVNAPEAA